MKPYEFALLRYMHDVVGGEFANIGVVMFDRTDRRLLTRVSDHHGRLSGFFGGVDAGAYRAMRRQLERLLQEAEQSLRQPELLAEPPAALSAVLAPIFPPEESCFRLSEVMAGVVENPEGRLDELFAEFVQRYDTRPERARRDEEAVRRDIDRRISHSDVLERVRFDYTIQAANYSHAFHASWQNGTTQVLDPISFDLADGFRIAEKANTWCGRLLNLSHGPKFAFTGIVAPPADSTLGRSFDRALAVLRTAPNVRQVILEEHADSVVEMIRRDTAGA